MEGQAYIVGLMLMIASPLAIASDEGQAFLENFDRTPDNQVYDVANDRTDMLDELDDSILNDRPNDMDTREVTEDCYTLEQWKERLAERDWNKEDWEQESDEVREEKDDGARGNSDAKEEKEDYNKETDKVTDKVTDKDCFTEAEFEEFVDTMGKDERKDKEDCVTIADFRDRLEEIREGDDRVWDDDDEDDRDEESNEDEGARGEDEEESDEDHDLNDEEKSELFAVIGELKEACENGDEAACVELRELVEEHWGDWERDDEDRDWEQKDGADSRCVPKHMLHHMKEKFGRDRGHKDKESVGRAEFIAGIADLLKEMQDGLLARAKTYIPAMRGRPPPHGVLLFGTARETGDLPCAPATTVSATPFCSSSSASR